MDEKQMLELAAKAAGIEILAWKDRVNPIYALINYKGKGPTIAWSPLTDDGDALRLAVKLHISVRHFWNNVAAIEDGAPFERASRVFVNTDVPEDRIAATRLAIVRAAAAIGEQSNE